MPPPKKLKSFFNHFFYKDKKISFTFGFMTAQNILNIAGLLTGMSGAYIMFYFSPKVDSGTWLYLESEADKIKKRDRQRNKMIRNGMLLLFAGFLLQLIAIFV